MEEIRLNHLRTQQASGIDLIPVNDFTFYDHMLDTAAMFGLVPGRFGYEGGEVPLSAYFAMARGSEGAPACEMTKWFNTNYHYIVPELNGAEPQLTVNKPLLAYREAKLRLGIEGKPVLIGPYTFLKLSKGYKTEHFDKLLERFVPLYARILSELEQEGAQWVQIDEPILATSLTEADMERVAFVYKKLHEAAPRLKLMLQTYFDAVDLYEHIAALPVQGIGLDFAHGLDKNSEHLLQYGFPADKTLGVGLIDGRGIWRSDLDARLRLLHTLSPIVPYERMMIQPSCSLLHVPVTAAHETKLEPTLRNALAFANEKLEELVLLTRAVNEGPAAIAAELEQSRQAVQELNASPSRNNERVQSETSRIALQPSERSRPFAERRAVQQSKWNLPFLPTTTIGSFSQTLEVRQARKHWRSGEWTRSSMKPLSGNKFGPGSLCRRNWIWMCSFTVNLNGRIWWNFSARNWTVLRSRRTAGYSPMAPAA